MALRNDRVGELLEGDFRKRKVLVSPEGVPLNIRIAGNGERVKALALDLLFMLVAITIIFVIFIITIAAKFNIYVSATIFMLLFFVIRNMYFIHFELAWQGRTPGKRICGLRVINRSGGELTPGAVIARNLTREVELFLPISLFFSIFGSGLLSLTALGWVLLLTCLPLFNREHLRAGDLIGGTMVISMPKRALLGDLTLAPSLLTNTANVNPNVTQNNALEGRYAFSHDQLSIYGAFELQVLEEFLRRPPSAETESILTEICAKICKKINWQEPVSRFEVRRFLNDFYAAERAELERGQLFGKLREDKTQGAQKTYPKSPVI